MNANSINEIMKLITSEYSWEQIIYKIIAWEGLDPWDLDIRALSDSFVQYLAKLEQLDFKVPAKYVVIAAVLLRMKSDHLEFLDFLTDYDAPEPEEADVEAQEADERLEDFQISPITVPPKRQPMRRVMVTELISALRKVLETEERRKVRVIRRRGQIDIKDSGIANRISQLYDRIKGLLSSVRKSEGRELRFSELIEKRSRENLVNTFVPLVYLENEKRVQCKQERMFDEIYISKRK